MEKEPTIENIKDATNVAPQELPSQDEIGEAYKQAVTDSKEHLVGVAMTTSSEIPVAVISINTEDRQLQDRIDDLFHEKGLSFIAFLTLPDVNPKDENIAEQYDQAIMGEFENMKEFAENLFEGLGFKEIFEKTVEKNGLPPGIIKYDVRAFYPQLREVYDIVELGDRIYVFSK